MHIEHSAWLRHGVDIWECRSGEKETNTEAGGGIYAERPFHT